MIKLLVMTDMHLTAGDEQIIGLDPFQRFQNALDHAERMHPDAQRLILTGDLAHRGDLGAYHRLRNALANRPWPVSFLLGNHDDRGTFRGVFPEASDDGAGFVQSALDLGPMRIITLDTLHTETEIAEAGYLCQHRLAWLKTALSTAEKPCLIFMHHPPFITGFNGMDGIRLLNDEAFADVVKGTGVAHIFAGHVHRTIHGSVRGIPATIFKSTCHQMPMLLGKEGFGHSVDEPGAYGIVIADDANVVVHFEDVSLREQPVSDY